MVWMKTKHRLINLDHIMEFRILKNGSSDLYAIAAYDPKDYEEIKGGITLAAAEDFLKQISFYLSSTCKIIHVEKAFAKDKDVEGIYAE